MLYYWQSCKHGLGLVICAFCAPLQTKSMTELYQHAQKYNSQLQEYNTKMQAELQAANESVVRVQVGLWGQALCTTCAMTGVGSL